MADPGFPRGTPNSGMGGWVCRPNILQKYCQKLHENGRIWTKGKKTFTVLLPYPGIPLLLDPPVITEFRIDLFAYRTERHQTVREELAD